MYSSKPVSVINDYCTKFREQSHFPISTDSNIGAF